MKSFTFSLRASKMKKMQIYGILFGCLNFFSFSLYAQVLDNPCGSGYFMDSKGNCYACQSEQSAPSIMFNETALATCLACGNREAVDGLCRPGGCIRGRHFRDEKGGCYPCDSGQSVKIGTNSSDQDMCRACLNREITLDGSCQLKASECLAQKGFFDTLGNCLTCEYPEKVKIRTDKNSQNMCYACGNREVTMGQVCQIKTSFCRKGQKFQGLEEACYDCQIKEPIEIGKNVLQQYGCYACGNRFATKAGFCVLKVAPEDKIFLTEKGVSYACDEPESIAIGYDKILQDLCVSCGRVVEKDVCRLAQPNDIVVQEKPTVKSSQQTFAGLSGRVYACDVATGIPIGKDPIRRESCLDCPQRFVATGDLCLLKECPQTNQFMDAIGLCHDCTEPIGIYVGQNEQVLENMCTACPGRYVLNGLCLPEDSFSK